VGIVVSPLASKKVLGKASFRELNVPEAHSSRIHPLSAVR
jgi:hypothetical protein